jgi:predicted metal-dependent HD superfamily phosphohydrolase
MRAHRGGWRENGGMQPTLADRLLERWDALLPGSQALGVELVGRYDHATRHYHDLRHLLEVLDRIELLARQHGYDVTDALLFAAWFHDSVYDMRRTDNEEESARFAEDGLSSHGVSADVVAEVARLVRITGHHKPETGDTQAETLCDADLAILASDPARYAEYVRGVRAEYHRVRDAEFSRRRAEVLVDLLDREHLFSTPAGRTWWEERARKNVAAELEAFS